MPANTRVAVAGLGAIGRTLARELDQGGLPGLQLGAVSARDPDKARAFVRELRHAVPVVEIEELGEHGDIVVECAPAALLARIAEPALARGRTVVVLSVGALLDHPHLRQAALDGGGAILVPTGALLGLDAMLAAAEGTIHSVHMTTRKPPQGLAGAPLLVARGIDVSDLKEPLRLFSGTAREAIAGFPANVNVAVALSLAGVGPDRTLIDIWADPGVSRNTHRIEVDSDSARISMCIESVPSENPKTGVITARSVIALLRKMTAPVRIGT